MHIRIAEGVRGFFACLVCWEEDIGMFIPEQSGFGSYATFEEALPEAKQWALDIEVPFLRDEET